MVYVSNFGYWFLSPEKRRSSWLPGYHEIPNTGIFSQYQIPGWKMPYHPALIYVALGITIQFKEFIMRWTIMKFKLWIYSVLIVWLFVQYTEGRQQCWLLYFTVVWQKTWLIRAYVKVKSGCPNEPHRQYTAHVHVHHVLKEKLWTPCTFLTGQ